MDNSRKNTLIFPGLTVNYQSELMENYIAESSINAGAGLKVIKLNDDEAIIFFITKKTVLNALISNSGNGSGWLVYHLSDENAEATAFDVCLDEKNNELRIAFGQRIGGKNELKISQPIHLNAVQPSEFMKMISYDQKKLEDDLRSINHITMDSGGLLFSTKQKETDAKYHYTTYAAQPENFALAENTNQIKQLKLGKLSGKFGVFILYDMPGQGRTMAFQSFRRPNQKEVMVRRFAIEDDVNAFDLLPNRKGDSVLYLAGKGIYSYENHNADRQIIAGPEVEFSKIQLSRNDSDISIWAIGSLNGNSGLYFVSNNFYTSTESGLISTSVQWTAPIQMHEHVDEFASIRGSNFINQLFLFGQTPDGEGLIHFWQDGVSTTWQESFPSIPSLSNAMEVSSYTIDLDFTVNAGSDPLTDDIEISSEENLILYINNSKYALVKGKVQYIAYRSSINILYPTQSLAMPKLKVSAKFLDDPIVIDPTKGIRKELNSRINSGTDLAEMRKQDGMPLVKIGTDQSTLDQVAAALISVLHQTENIGEVKNNNQMEEISLKFEPRETAITVALEMGFIDNIGNAIGDVWHSVKKGFNEITGFVIKQVGNVITFVIELGNKIIEWVVDTVKSAVAFLERIWEKIKVFFKDLYETLAFLFGWDDILNTKNALKQMGLNYLADTKENIGVYKKLAVDYILEIREKYQKMDKAIKDKYAKKDNLLDMIADNASKETVDSRTNWVNSKKDVMLSKDTKLGSSVIDEQKANEIQTKAESESIPSELTKLLLQLLKGEIGFGEFFEKFVSKITLLALDLAVKVVELFFDLILKTVGFIEKLLYSPIDVPLISYLYKKISDSELSVADLICLLIAIPTTVGYKLANGEAPFKAEEDQNFIKTLSFN